MTTIAIITIITCIASFAVLIGLRIRESKDAKNMRNYISHMYPHLIRDDKFTNRTNEYLAAQLWTSHKKELCDRANCL